ncbi:MAG: HD domain-containing phosphohydrolase, partial [Solirubrobacteraceae bacterium]
RRALSLGASDFLSKPADPVEVLLRTNNLLRAYRLRNHLNDLVERATADVEQARLETLACLATAAEYRDDQSGRHTQRVGHTAGLIAQQIGLASESVELIRSAAPLHDIGKLGISDSILLKPGSLTDRELAMMRTHAEIGAQILASGRSPVLRLAREIALSHHERWDGNGYPHGLAGETIPIEARITAIADVFDALTHARPYKPAWPLQQAVEELKSERAKHFDPDVVDAFMTLEHESLVEPEETVLAPGLAAAGDPAERAAA